MNREETTRLCRYVKACCPQQAIDEFTPDTWHDFIRDLALDDCLAAVRNIVARQPFIAVSDVLAEVKRIRADRLANSDLALPAADPDDPQAYAKALRNITGRIADGAQPFNAIGPAGQPPAGPPIDIVQEIRDDLAARRASRTKPKERPVAAGPTCQCGTLLDPDGTCFMCRAKEGAS